MNDTATTTEDQDFLASFVTLPAIADWAAETFDTDRLTDVVTPNEAESDINRMRIDWKNPETVDDTWVVLRADFATRPSPAAEDERLAEIERRAEASAAKVSERTEEIDRRTEAVFVTNAANSISLALILVITAEAEETAERLAPMTLTSPAETVDCVARPMMANNDLECSTLTDAGSVTS